MHFAHGATARLKGVTLRRGAIGANYDDYVRTLACQRCDGGVSRLCSSSSKNPSNSIALLLKSIGVVDSRGTALLIISIGNFALLEAAALDLVGDAGGKARRGSAV